MMSIRKIAALVLALAAAAPAALAVFADEPKAAEPGTLIVVDGAGKEQKLKSWKFTTGVRPLKWLAAKVEKDKDDKDKKAGEAPMALEVREENSTSWKDGVVTLVPLNRLKEISYDADKQTASIRVASSEKADAEETLTGTTEYEATNRLTIEAEVDKGALGVAEVVYKGGAAKGGVKAIRFPPAKPEAAAAGGRPALVTIADKRGKNSFKALDVKALYKSDGGETVLPTLMFKKTIKMDLGQVTRINSDAIGSLEDPVWQVVLKDGTDENFTLIRSPTLDGKKMTLEGILARVPAGYRIVPIHALAGVDFEKLDVEEKPKDKEEKKDKN
jgi:hypothetical protein